MRLFTIKRMIVVLFLLLSGLQAGASLATPGPDESEARAKLLGYMLRNLLTTNHYSHKPINDDLSAAAFDLYLKQLDFQKRFLLQTDVERLRAFSLKIDDEIKAGPIELPLLAAAISEERIAQVQTMVEEILAEPFDFRKKESFEADPEKLPFCSTLPELRERWRQVLKYQVITRYLNLQEDEAAAVGGETKETKGKKDEQALRAEAREKVLKSNREFFARMRQDTPQDHYDRYFNAVTRAFDPHTNYLPPDKKEDFDIGMRGSLEGIGATLREEDGYIRVVAVIPGSAAFRQGQLQAEDVILQVAEKAGEPVDVTDMRLRDAVNLIRGKKGTEVRLTVKKPDGRRLIIPIVRDVVQIEETFVKGLLLPDPAAGKTWGYLKIPGFYRDFQASRHGGEGGRNVTDDVEAELKRFRAAKIDGLVLDLRNNGGGALTDAIRIAGLFIKEGPVVQVRESGGRSEVLADQDPAVAYGGPLVVLVNRFSASASEILAGALQDYGRAVIIGGDHTHGKGTVQTVIDLDRSLPIRNMEKYQPLGAVKVTIQKFYRVSGESTQAKGVVPDVVLPDPMAYLETGEQYLDYALPWDTVAPAAYQKWGDLNLNLIRFKSRQRTAAAPAFLNIAAEVRLAREKNEQTRQSLHIEEIRRERDEARKLEAKAGGGGGFHGAAAKKNGQDPAAREQSPEEALRQSLTDDAYAREAMAILGDLLAAPRTLSAGSPGAGS